MTKPVGHVARLVPFPAAPASESGTASSQKKLDPVATQYRGAASLRDILGYNPRIEGSSPPIPVEKPKMSREKAQSLLDADLLSLTDVQRREREEALFIVSPAELTRSQREERSAIMRQRTIASTGLDLIADHADQALKDLRVVW